MKSTRRLQTAILMVAVLALIPALASAQGVLFVKDGKVGVGTANPAAIFDVSSDAPTLKFSNTVAVESFNFSVNPYGAFTVNKAGTGGQEFSIRSRNDADGPTLDVQGSVKGTVFINASSRALKTGFQALDTVQVLNGLSSLEMTSWRYKTEPESALHYGAIAEDFQATFGLGDGKSISTVDASGVAFAAIQGLHTKLLERDAHIASLEARLAALETKLNE